MRRRSGSASRRASGSFRPDPFDRALKDRVDRIPVGVADDITGTVRERLLGVLFSQTVDILDRDIGEPADLDFGCRQALGFKKGPLELMRDLGDGEAGRMLARFCNERRGMPAARKPLGHYQGFLRHVLVDDIGDKKEAEIMTV